MRVVFTYLKTYRCSVVGDHSLQRVSVVNCIDFRYSNRLFDWLLLLPSGVVSTSSLSDLVLSINYFSAVIYCLLAGFSRVPVYSHIFGGFENLYRAKIMH